MTLKSMLFNNALEYNKLENLMEFIINNKLIFKQNLGKIEGICNINMYSCSDCILFNNNICVTTDLYQDYVDDLTMIKKYIRSILYDKNWKSL